MDPNNIYQLDLFDVGGNGEEGSYKVCRGCESNLPLDRFPLSGDFCFYCEFH